MLKISFLPQLVSRSELLRTSTRRAATAAATPVPTTTTTAATTTTGQRSRTDRSAVETFLRLVRQVTL